MSKIRAKCCNTVLESTHVHDFKYCPCGKVMIDGGDEYLRYGWPDGDPRDYVEVIQDAKNATESNEDTVRRFRKTKEDKEKTSDN